MKFNFSREISDHCEYFYCLSLSYDEFDERFAEYLIRCASYHPKKFLSTFFCNFSVNFSGGLVVQNL